MSDAIAVERAGISLLASGPAAAPSVDPADPHDVRRADGSLLFRTSHFVAYRRCPRLWWASEVARLPELPSDAQRFGTATAAVLERHLTGRDPFPAGWERAVSDAGEFRGELDVFEQGLARRLLEAARPVLARELDVRGGLAIEAGWTLPLLDASLADGRLCEACRDRDERTWNCLEHEGHLVARDLPAVSIRGTVDVADARGILDHKTVKSLEWAKKPEQLRDDVQMLTYAYPWLLARRARGLPDPRFVDLRHVAYSKSDGQVRVIRAEPAVTPAEVEAAWEQRKREAREMRLLCVEGNGSHITGDDESLARWFSVPAAGSPSDARNRKGACGLYKGCAFAGICGGSVAEGGGGETPALYRRRVAAERAALERRAAGLPPERTEVALVDSIFKGRFAAGVAASPGGNGVVSAPAPVPASPSATPAPASAPVAASGSVFGARAGIAATGSPSIAAPAPAAPAPTVPAFAPAPPAATGKLAEGAPPHANPSCGACVRDGRATGMRAKLGPDGKPAPCPLCNANSGRLADIYEFCLADGEILYQVKAEHAGRCADGGLPEGGSMRAPWLASAPPAAGPSVVVPSLPASVSVGAALTVASPPPSPAAPPAPPPSPAAPPALVISSSGTSAEPAKVEVRLPEDAPSDEPESDEAAADAADAPKKKRGARKSFVLCVNCAPGGRATVVPLAPILFKYAGLMEQESGKKFWTELDPFRRRDLLVASAPAIFEQEKLAGKVVVSQPATVEERMLCDALAAMEGAEVYRGLA